MYYPRSQGGGSKRIFVKMGDSNAEFYPDVNTVRRDGSYIYEEFIMTQGTDIKVYAVGLEYAHAEGKWAVRWCDALRRARGRRHGGVTGMFSTCSAARKSAVVDGRVNLDKAGKEVRVPLVVGTSPSVWCAIVALLMSADPVSARPHAARAAHHAASVCSVPA